MKTLFSLLIIALFVSCSNNDKTDSFQISTLDFLRNIPAYTQDSLVNIVVEIPAGCNQKWEVNKQTGFLEWERINDDSLRVVRYLPYPANYGMIPRTWLPEVDGGDNDPLDVFLLGERVERGSIVPARVIGIIRMLDRGEQDDKLIAVPADDWHYDIDTIDSLNEQFPGITDLLVSWLLHYKGAGWVEFQGVDNEEVAVEILHTSIKAYDASGGEIL